MQLVHTLLLAVTLARPTQTPSPPANPSSPHTPTPTPPTPPANPSPIHTHPHQAFIDMLNSCGVQTPTTPLPPCIMAPRGAAPAEIMRRAAEGEGRVERCWVKRQAG